MTSRYNLRSAQKPPREEMINSSASSKTTNRRIFNTTTTNDLHAEVYASPSPPHSPIRNRTSSFSSMEEEELEDEEEYLFQEHSTDNWQETMQSVPLKVRMKKWGSYFMEKSLLSIGFLWFLLPAVCVFLAFIIPKQLIHAIGHSSSSTAYSDAPNSSFQKEYIESMIQKHVESNIRQPPANYTKSSQEILRIVSVQKNTSADIVQLKDSLNKLSVNLANIKVPSTENSFQKAVIANTVDERLKKFIEDQKAVASEFRNSITKLSKTLTTVTDRIHVLEQKQNDLELSNSELFASVKQLNHKKIEAMVQDKMEKLKQFVGSSISQSINEKNMIAKDQVELITQKYMRDVKYRAEKIDYANVLSGARVIYSDNDVFQDNLFGSLRSWFPGSFYSQYTSSSYRSAVSIWCKIIKLLGFSTTINKSPEIAITKSVEVGNCWAFHGGQGNLSVQFAQSIFADSISLQHVPFSLSVQVNSAPRDFSVWGFSIDQRSKILQQHFLGNFSFNYEADSSSLQTFALPNNAKRLPIDGAILQVENNYGNIEFTCIYRFMVHGKPI